MQMYSSESDSEVRLSIVVIQRGFRVFVKQRLVLVAWIVPMLFLYMPLTGRLGFSLCSGAW